ncbi:Fasciclin domain protein [compost metagenome]
MAGNFNAATILKTVKEKGGKAQMVTVEGGIVTFWMKGKDLYVRDTKGKDAKVTIADVQQSNGVIHVIDHVLMP